MKIPAEFFYIKKIQMISLNNSVYVISFLSSNSILHIWRVVTFLLIKCFH